MMNGAHLRGSGQRPMQPMAGGTGADLAGGEAMPQAGGGGGSDAIQAIFQAAAAAGLQIDPQQAMQDPEAMQAVLDAAAQSDLGASDGGIDTIMTVAEQMGLQSPYRRQQQGAPDGAPDYARGGQASGPLQ